MAIEISSAYVFNSKKRNNIIDSIKYKLYNWLKYSLVIPTNVSLRPKKLFYLNLQIFKYKWEYTFCSWGLEIPLVLFEKAYTPENFMSKDVWVDKMVSLLMTSRLKGLFQNWYQILIIANQDIDKAMLQKKIQHWNIFF